MLNQRNVILETRTVSFFPLQLCKCVALKWSYWPRCAGPRRSIVSLLVKSFLQLWSEWRKRASSCFDTTLEQLSSASRTPRTTVAFVSGGVKCVVASAGPRNGVSQRSAAEHAESLLSDQQHCVLLQCHANNSEWRILSAELVMSCLRLEAFLVFTYCSLTVLNCNLTRLREKCRWFCGLTFMFKSDCWRMMWIGFCFLSCRAEPSSSSLCRSASPRDSVHAKSDGICRAGSFHLQDAVAVASNMQRCFRQVARTSLQLLSSQIKSCSGQVSHFVLMQ